MQIYDILYFKLFILYLHLPVAGFYAAGYCAAGYCAAGCWGAGY